MSAAGELDAAAALGGSSLARLSYKYARLVELREARARGEPIPPRAVFRELAREFPGCLAELDALPMDVLAARARATASAAQGASEAEPWMTWMGAYHALFRAALYAKPRVSRAAELDDARAAAIAAEASRHASASVDAEFVRAVSAPPGGRLAVVVLAAVASRAGVEAAAVKRALFPAARR